MKKLLPLFCLSLLIFSQCKIIKYTPEKLPVKQMIFGGGGGFAGIETSYTMLENGQIFKKTGVNGAYVELAPVKVKQAKELFSKLSSVQLYKLDIDKPGNLYYFLQEVNSNIDSRATWGAGDYLPPQSLVNMYKEVYAIVKDRKSIKEGKPGLVKEEKEKKKEGEQTRW